MSTDIDATLSRLKRPLLYVMGIFHAGAGVIHFVAPKVYVLGIGVLIRWTRQRSAWGLIALLIAVFPTNVHMATSDVATDAAPDWADGITRAAMWARLPLQAS